jgi:hypothetical protein
VDLQPAIPGPLRVTLRVEYPNGAYRQFTAGQPVGYVLRVQESGTPGEPLITARFAGNPDAGGMQVSQEGVPG